MTKLMNVSHNFAKGPKSATLCTFWDDLKHKNHVAVSVNLYKLHV